MTIFKLKLLGDLEFGRGILAMSSFINSYLLVSCGELLVQVKIDASTRKIVGASSIAARFPIKKIITQENRIVLSGFQDSVSVYDFDTTSKTFKFLKSDRYIRWSLDALWSNNMIVASERYGYIYGLDVGTFYSFRKPILSTRHSQSIFRDIIHG